MLTRRHALFSFSAIGAVLLCPRDSLALPVDATAPLNSEAILIVFPNYPVQTDTWYGYANNVGHAGVLLIRNDGFTKYFEFGRYNGPSGSIRNISVDNVLMDATGKATGDSLKIVLSQLSARTGKNTSIRGAYFINMDFDKMLSSANSHPGAYSAINNNCGHYAERVILSGNSKVDKPIVVDITPNNLVDEYLEEKNSEVFFDPSTGNITIGTGDESDAKT